jgi:hypothetical protein
MKKYIVTTSIYEPSEATKKFAQMQGWTLIVVGDKKTPHKAYDEINCIYLHPDEQERLYKNLSDAIGWNCVMRRNIGFVYAYTAGADIVATIDDDNIPYDHWGQDVKIGQTISVDRYTSYANVFDPMQCTNHPELWHRGYPLNCIPQSKHVEYLGKHEVTVQIQADLWDGDPDVDAVCRLTTGVENLKLIVEAPFTTPLYVPFNSQNTFISREALPYYMVLPHVGRMDDIWGGYICEFLTGFRPLFMPPSVFQKRNIQSIRRNLSDEVLGYNYTNEFINRLSEWETVLGVLSPKALKAFIAYRQEFS